MQRTRVMQGATNKKPRKEVHDVGVGYTKKPVEVMSELEDMDFEELDFQDDKEDEEVLNGVVMEAV